MTDCSEILQFFKSGDDDALHQFLTDKESTGYVRESCIPASVYKQEPTCPADFPPNDENLTPLQWLAIFMKDGLFGNEAVNYYMLDVTQDYGADGKGKGNYRDCFFKGPIQEDKGLDYSPVVLACIFDNFRFLSMVNLSSQDYTVWDTRYEPRVQNTERLYQCDVREFKPLQIASILGSHEVINYLAHEENVYVNQKPVANILSRYGSKHLRGWIGFNPLTLSIVGFGLPLEDWDLVSRSVRPTRTREEYITSIDSLLDAEHVTINLPDVNVSIINWSAMYELIHNAFGKEYTKGDEQDLFNNEVLELFLPTRHSRRTNPNTLETESILVEDLDFNISAPEVLQGLDRSSNLSARKRDQTPSPVSESEKIRRRMFIYDTLIKQRYLLRPKIDEINLKKLIMKNVEETLPDMMEYLIATGEYHTRATIAMSRLNREKENVERLKGSEKLNEDTLKKIRGYVTRTGGRKKSKKTKKSRKTKRKGKKSKKSNKSKK